MTLGLIFGTTRQMQGVHFLSHTLATISLDWFACTPLCLATIGKDEIGTPSVKFLKTYRPVERKPGGSVFI